MKVKFGFEGDRDPIQSSRWALNKYGEKVLEKLNNSIKKKISSCLMEMDFKLSKGDIVALESFDFGLSDKEIVPMAADNTYVVEYVVVYKDYLLVIIE